MTPIGASSAHWETKAFLQHVTPREQNARSPGARSRSHEWQRALISPVDLSIPVAQLHRLFDAADSMSNSNGAGHGRGQARHYFSGNGGSKLVRQQQQPGDEQQTWPREQLTEMDLQFCEAMERAFSRGRERRASASLNARPVAPLCLVTHQRAPQSVLDRTGCARRACQGSARGAYWGTGSVVLS